MATLLFSALGTIIGGPLGGAIGALVGRQVDNVIIGGGTREGPRLKELAASTSSYGAPLARQFGQMRVAGSIIWATDLIEHRDKQGGGKGKPSVTSYTYTASFAVALSSRPVSAIGRIWADGHLLRGAAGDLKTGGTMRLHTGSADQAADPLILAAEGADSTPAFRGLAYVVFEDLQLADFGNRIPALTFEVFADTGALTLAHLADGAIDDIDAAMPLPGVAGLALEGSLGDSLALLDPVFPLDCDACGDLLVLSPERLQTGPITLPQAAASVRDEDFGAQTGYARKRSAQGETSPGILRYYDLDRDYQPGLQRAPGRPGPGQPATIELPAAMAAADARALVARAARRGSWARESLAWRTSELDPAIAPGAVVTVPGQSGRWRVSEWEWREGGVELTLERSAPGGISALAASDPGRVNPPSDLTRTPTTLAAFELPWDGAGTPDMVTLFAAASSAGTGWNGAALFADQGDGSLQPLGPSGRERATIGLTEGALPLTSPHLFDRQSSLVVQLIGQDMALTSISAQQAAMGANKALVGQEIVQFLHAAPLGSGSWRIGGLLRGRGGTESAIAGHVPGERFVLLDGTATVLDPAIVGTSPAVSIAAIGLADPSPITAPIALRGASLRPLSPVHPRSAAMADGGLALRWTRRARGAWTWPDGIDAALAEQSESYQVTYGPPATPLAAWDVTAPELLLTSAELAPLAAALSGGAFHVRQRGTHALSGTLFLTNLS